MNRRSISRPRWRRGAMVAPAMLFLLAAEPASAQFSWFGSREASPQDVSDTIADHGFTLVGPLYRNGRVYLADVIDRRRRRERLVIAADSGEIIQRYFVDVGPGRRAPVAAPRQTPRDESFFSHLTRGWDDEAPPRPPTGIPGQDVVVVPAPTAPLARPKPQSRVLTRTETPAVTASPLPPPGSVTAKPEAVTVPTPREAAPSNVRGTSVSSDPLRIPGTRKAEEARAAKPAGATSAAAGKTAAEPTVAAPPAPAKPKPAPAADVPVAPLD